MRDFPSIFESILDLSKSQIEELLISAKNFKDNPKNVPQYDNPRPVIMNFFLENSTRTTNSFALSAKRLGAHYLDFNPTTSSLNKGEALEETLLTLSAQGVDLVVMRTSASHLFGQYKSNPPIKIINGGDGTNQHPTQALLDIFTMKTLGLDISNMTMTIVGDCKHSRVANSLIDVFGVFGGKVILCGPNYFMPDDLLLDHVEFSEDLESSIKKSDLTYLLRVQKERHTNDDFQIQDYIDNYGLTKKKLNAWNITHPVFHPGPANINTEIDYELIKSNQYKGYQQVAHSVPMRMAIIHQMLKGRNSS